MSRIRTLKPDALQHRKVGQLSDRAFRLWILLITQADDDGRLICEIAQLRVLGWGYHPRVTLHHIETALKEVATLGLIRLYSVNGTRYADFPSWKDHQSIRHTSYYRPSKLPSIYSLQSHSASIPPQQADNSATPPPLKELNLKEHNLRESTLSADPEQNSGSTVEEWPAEDLWLKEFLLTQTWLPSPHTALYEHAWWDRVSEIVNGLDETIIRQEFARMGAWCQENPSRRPTGKGIRRFIRGWFERRYERERRQRA